MVIQPPIKDDDLFTFNDYDYSFLIDQLDGNVSVSSSCIDPHDIDNVQQHITVQTGHRPSSNLHNPRLPHVRKTIRRDNKVLQAITLPKMSNYNMRSLMPKIFNLGMDMGDRDCLISFLTEVWQKAENKKHQYKIEELFEMKGMK